MIFKCFKSSQRCPAPMPISINLLTLVIYRLSDIYIRDLTLKTVAVARNINLKRCEISYGNHVLDYLSMFNSASIS
jgi:hypothetical protein